VGHADAVPVRHDPDRSTATSRSSGSHSTGNGTTWRDQHLGSLVPRRLDGLQRLHLGWRFDPERGRIRVGILIRNTL
jgi:hypothetical protein